MALTNQTLRFLSGLDSYEVSTLGVASAPQPYKNYVQQVLKDTGTASDSNYINKLGYKAGTLTSGSSVTINLYDGSMTGTDGITSVSLATLKTVHVFLTSTTGTLSIGNAASNCNQLWFGADAHTQTIKAGGLPFAQGDLTGVTVDASNCNVKITNSGGASCDYLFLCSGK